jgi:glycosyltransferase involved in cell wall biosynthesis
MSPSILLDLSRLLLHARQKAPTGIERVELAYARHFLDAGFERLDFAGMAWGRLGPLPKDGVAAFIEVLSRRWSGATPQRDADADLASQARRLKFAAFVKGEAMLYARMRRTPGPRAYLLVSHHHLDRPRLIARLKARAGARLVVLIHDLIPIDYPEYVRPGQNLRYAMRMDTVARMADAVIFASAATRRGFEPFLESTGRKPPLLVAPLGIDLRASAPIGAISPTRPYFVCVGTIEPRKNHLLLLNIWCRMIGELGPRAPGLLLLGQRGWENENVIAMIERSIALRGIVEERAALSDGAMAQLMRGARTLLLPSFAEGYGLPVAEALALGVPVVCSDLPALREAGGDVPDYLDPLDGRGWAAAVLDYMQEDSPRLQAQLRRLSNWRAPGWEEHFAAVDALIDRVCS